MAAGSLLAIGIGRLLTATPTIVPPPFFAPETFVAYLAAGIGPVLLVLFVFMWRAFRRDHLWGGMLAVSAALPLLFYATLLYSPRHLFVVTVGTLATAFLPVGRDAWACWRSPRLRQGVLLVVALVTFVPWVVGVRMSDWTRGRPVLSESTLYPTSDGFWPLGTYGWFLGQLAHAAERPIDHNQEIWAAWLAVPASRVPQGKLEVASSGLISLGRFALTHAGFDSAVAEELREVILLDDRTLVKRQVGVRKVELKGRRELSALFDEGQVEVLAEAEGRMILAWIRGGERKPLPERLKARLVLQVLHAGNDFRLFAWDPGSIRKERRRNRVTCLASPSREWMEQAAATAGGTLTEITPAATEETWWAMTVDEAAVEKLLAGRDTPADDVWFSQGMLAHFMDVRRYRPE